MKKYLTIISMMSGTSMDGIDAIIVKIAEDYSFEIMDSHSLEYPLQVQKKLLHMANNNASVQDVCLMNFIVGKLFAQCTNELLQKSFLEKDDIDFISTHGQTVYHIPTPVTIDNLQTKSTLQIGDISVIAAETGIMTIGDFRPKDIAVGGDGAPLVAFADELIFSRKTPRAIQNIGGIANVTVLSPNYQTFAFDTGVGNIMLDYCAKKFFNSNFDRNGIYAAQGTINEEWLKILLKEPYYMKYPPKTTGRELFTVEYIEKMLKLGPTNKYDVMSTLTALTAKTIQLAYERFIFSKVKLEEMVLGGGGAYNLYLKSLLKIYLPTLKIKTHADFNIENKHKEALAFAFLGYNTYYKRVNNCIGATGAKKQTIMGKIAY